VVDNATTKADGAPPAGAPRLDALGRGAARAVARDTLGTRALLALTLSAAVLTAGGATDAWLGFGAAGRSVLLLVWLSATGAALLWCRRGWTERVERRRDALLRLERAQAVSGEVLINAWDLAHDRSDGVSPALRNAVVKRGDELAGTVPIAGLARRDARQRAVWALAAVVAVVAFSGAAWPKAWLDVLPRLALPFADLPPYTPLRFDITAQPERVVHGQSAKLRVGVTHPDGVAHVPSEVELVIMGDSGERRVAMEALTPDTQAARLFSHRLDRVERDIRFYIDTPAGRSHTRTLRVVPVPRFVAATATITPPEYTGLAPRTQALKAGDATPLTLLAGSELRLDISSTLPLEAAALTLEEQDADEPRAMALTIDEGMRTTAGLALEPTGDAAFTLSLVGPDATPGDTTRHGRVTVEPDQPAQVEWRRPGSNAIVPEGESFTVDARGRDDVQLQELTLMLSVNDGEPVALEAPMQRNNRAAGRVQATVDTGRYRLSAGDRVTLLADATDTVATGRRTTRIQGPTVEVVDQQAYLEQARRQFSIDKLQREWQQWRDRVEQASAADDAQARGELAEAMRERARQPALNEIDRATRDRLAEAAGELESDTPTSAAQQAMQATANELADLEMANALQRAASSSDAAALKSLSDASGANLPASAKAAASQADRGGSNSGDDQRAMDQALQRDLDGKLGLDGQTLTESLKSIRDAQSAGAAAATTGGGGRATGQPELLGPHAGLNPASDSDATGGADAPAGGTGPFGGGVGFAETDGQPELLIPDARGNPSAAAPPLDAVPQRFRPLAEGYFRRLAEDAAGPAPDGLD